MLYQWSEPSPDTSPVAVGIIWDGLYWPFLNRDTGYWGLKLGCCTEFEIPILGALIKTMEIWLFPLGSKTKSDIYIYIYVH